MRHFTRAEMEQAFNHFSGERMPGVGPQDVHVVSTVQRYLIGARKQIGARVYHYARAGGVLVPDNGAQVKDEQDVAHRAVAIAPLGSRTIVITIANPDGPAYDGSMPLNYLQGGSVVVFKTAVSRAYTRGIISNSLVVAPGGAMTVVLDAPIPEALTAADRAEGICSPYRCVVERGDSHLGAGFNMIAGIAGLPTILDDYLWLQTWGPCWLTPNANVGNLINRKQVVFNQQGMGFIGGDDAIYADIGQVAGTVMANSPAGTQGAPFVYLMIDP